MIPSAFDAKTKETCDIWHTRVSSSKEALKWLLISVSISLMAFTYTPASLDDDADSVNAYSIPHMSMSDSILDMKDMKGKEG
jgi:hypothetical protein